LSRVFAICLLLYLLGCQGDSRSDVWSEPTGAGLTADKEAQVSAFYNTGTKGSIATKDGLRLNYIYFDQDSTRPIVVVLNGMTESFRKYDEFFYDLTNRGFSIYALDHRGMGYSGRQSDNTQLVHINDPEDYVADFKFFMQKVVPTHGRTLYLFSHSTGGYVAISYAATHPKVFRRMVLSGPLMGIRIGFPDFLADAMLWLRRFMGKGEGPVSGSGTFDPSTAQFEGNRVTHSTSRFNHYIQQIKMEPELVMAGATNDWVVAMRKVLTPSWLQASAMQMVNPILIFQAGDDHFVRNDRHQEFCDLAKVCQIQRFQDGWHELYREVDEIRTPLLDSMVQFFRKGEK
jgi:lysophospholipase